MMPSEVDIITTDPIENGIIVIKTTCIRLRVAGRGG